MVTRTGDHDKISAGSQKRRERERAETRQKILDAARDMFVEHGYEHTTMRAIAERAEYTTSALYYHFRNKDELLVALSTADFRALAAAFQRIGRIEDPVARLIKIGETYVAFAVEHPMQYQLMFMTRHPNVAMRKGITRGDPSQDAYAFLRSACTEAIASGRLRAELNDPEEMSQMLWAALHGLLALHIVKRNGDQWIDWRDARATGSKICHVMMHGMLREPLT